MEFAIGRGQEYAQPHQPHYDFGGIHAIEKIGNGRNSLVHVHTEKGKAVLKTYRPEVPKESIHNEALLMNFLAENGFPVPTALPNSHGEFLSTTENGNHFFVQSFIEGYNPTHAKDVSDDQLQNAARMLATYHRFIFCLDAENIPNAVSAHTTSTAERFFNKEEARSSWEQALIAIHKKQTNDWIDEQILHVAPEKIQEIERIDEELLNNIVRQFPAVLSHGDFVPQNIIFKESEVVGIIDWEKARIQPRIFDLIKGMLGFSFLETTHLNNGPIDLERAKLFVQAYEEICPLTESEKYYLPDIAYILSLTNFFALSTHYGKEEQTPFPQDSSDWHWWRQNREVARKILSETPSDSREN